MTALLSALILVSILPLVISQTRLVSINRDALETNEEQYLTRSAVKLSGDFAHFFRSADSNLRRLADGLALAASISPEKNPFTATTQSDLLGRLVRSEPSFLVLRTLDGAGQGGGVQPDELDAAIDEELTKAYRAAMQGEAYVGPPIRSEVFKDGGIVLAVPVLVGDRGVLGAVEAFVSFGPLRRILDDERRRDVLAYVVDRKGALVLSSDPMAKAAAAEIAALDLVGEFTAHPARLTRSYERMDGGAPRRVLGTIAPVDGSDWGVLVEKDERRAYASVRQATWTSITGGVLALLFAILVAFVAARALSRPVTDLAAKAQSIAEGNYGERAEVRGTREIAALAETFNTMSQAVEEALGKARAAAKENQELFFNSIRALAAAIDAKDPYTRGHSERVARYAVTIARHMGLPTEEVRKVRIAALLHDVGKIGIDDRILRKPTALTDEEFEVMKTHPVKGAVIMGQIPQLREIIPGMKHHHEKWDGSGYPDGLLSEEIPMLARIVAVADTFDAMTTTRPYQKAMQLEYVVSRIKSFSGTRFDPVVVSALDKAFLGRDLEIVGEAARLAVAS